MGPTGSYGKNGRPGLEGREGPRGQPGPPAFLTDEEKRGPKWKGEQGFE